MRYECSFCTNSYARKDGLKRHINSKHSVQSNQKEKKFICNFCNKAWYAQFELNRHLKKVHKKKYKCFIPKSLINLGYSKCNCCFTLISQLWYHICTKHKNLVNPALIRLIMYNSISETEPNDLTINNLISDKSKILSTCDISDDSIQKYANNNFNLKKNLKLLNDNANDSTDNESKGQNYVDESRGYKEQSSFNPKINKTNTEITNNSDYESYNYLEKDFENQTLDENFVISGQLFGFDNNNSKITNNPRNELITPEKTIDNHDDQNVSVMLESCSQMNENDLCNTNDFGNSETPILKTDHQKIDSTSFLEQNLNELNLSSVEFEKSVKNFTASFKFSLSTEAIIEKGRKKLAEGKINPKNNTSTFDMLDENKIAICPFDECIGEHFVSRRSWYTHIQKHINPPYQCDLCFLQFISAVKFRLHKTSHSGVDLKSKSDSIHSKNNFDQLYICSFCNESFLNKRNFKIHYQSHLVVKEKKIVRCSSCFKQFISKTALQNHLKIHEPLTDSEQNLIESYVVKNEFEINEEDYNIMCCEFL